MTRLKTGIKRFDEITGGIESGSRTILYGPLGTGKTVFAMQFLWEGLKNGETVSYDVMDKPFERLRWYFKSFGWDIGRYEPQKFISIQAFPHFEPYPKDPNVHYFSLQDFEEMKKLDRMISDNHVTRFVAGDFSDQLFGLLDLEYMLPVEHWTINWSHYDNIANVDVMTQGTNEDTRIKQAVDLDLDTANNLILFRVNKKTYRRELRIVKMEGTAHPLDWIPFKITSHGIELSRKR